MRNIDSKPDFGLQIHKQALAKDGNGNKQDMKKKLNLILSDSILNSNNVVAPKIFFTFKKNVFNFIIHLVKDF